MKETESKYIEAVGRRKTAIARVRIVPSSKAKISYTVNGKDVDVYFPTTELRRTARDAFSGENITQKFDVSAHVNGGGSTAQAEALRHGIARALTQYNLEFRGVLKQAGYLKRDPRMKERKKFGLKKARRAPQWSKR